MKWNEKSFYVSVFDPRFTRIERKYVQTKHLGLQNRKKYVQITTQVSKPMRTVILAYLKHHCYKSEKHQYFLLCLYACRKIIVCIPFPNAELVPKAEDTRSRKPASKIGSRFCSIHVPKIGFRPLVYLPHLVKALLSWVDSLTTELAVTASRVAGNVTWTLKRGGDKGGDANTETAFVLKLCSVVEKLIDAERQTQQLMKALMRYLVNCGVTRT